MPRAGLDAEAVVTAAAALADADGLSQLTLAKLAVELGIRTPSLYAHVDGLDDLRARLGARGARQLAGALHVAAAGRARSDGLRAVAKAYREYAHAHPGTYAAMQIASDSDELRPPGPRSSGSSWPCCAATGWRASPRFTRYGRSAARCTASSHSSARAASVSP